MQLNASYKILAVPVPCILLLIFFSQLVPKVNVALDDALFAKLKNSGTIRYIKTLKEMNIDFLANEQQVFSFNEPLSVLNLYNPREPKILDDEIKKISKRVSLDNVAFIFFDHLE
jgi:hypothetical protein